MHKAQGHQKQPTSNRFDSVGGMRTENHSTSKNFPNLLKNKKPASYRLMTADAEHV